MTRLVEARMKDGQALFVVVTALGVGIGLGAAAATRAGSREGAALRRFGPIDGETGTRFPMDAQLLPHSEAAAARVYAGASGPFPARSSLP
jgi:hypothetical protein